MKKYINLNLKEKKDLYEMKDQEDIGDAKCFANYLNICLGKFLKKCGNTKDRPSRKILYCNKDDADKAVSI